MSIVLNDVVSNNNTSVMNANFAKIEDAINNDLLKREIEVGEANEMRTHLDMNANKQVNLLDGVDPNDAATVGQMEAFQDTISDGEDGADGATGATGAPGAKGDTGDTGADGEDGAGTVVSVVAGTNVTVDDTDPANPIVSSTGGTPSPLTTKGDVYTYDTAEQRLAVGTDGQVLTADSTEPTGLKFATPTGGGGGAGSHNTVPVAAGFWKSGVMGMLTSRMTDSAQVRANICDIDMVYFDGTEVVDSIGVATDSTTAGGTVRVGLHKIVKRGLFTAVSHTAEITVAASFGTHETTVTWTPSEGWYYVVLWTSSTVVDMLGIFALDSDSNGNGLMSHRAFLATNGTEYVTENTGIRLYASNYGADQDLTSYDLVTKANFTDNNTPTTNGDFSWSSSMPIIGFKSA